MRVRPNGASGDRWAAAEGAPMMRSWAWLKHWVWTLLDALPPYQKVEGPLDSKESDSNGKFYVCVGSARVEVDHATFEALMVGESLRMRYTRGNRAVNIDRLLSETGPG